MCTGITAVRLNRLTVPELQDYREHATLVCDYELITNKLNSVKWYKDGSEFFRYAPMQQSGVSLFKVAGVHVHNNSIDCDTRTCRIQLWYLQPQSSGLYRCEVSGDAPDFKLVYRMANMTVGGEFWHITDLSRQRDFLRPKCVSFRSPTAARSGHHRSDADVRFRRVLACRVHGRQIESTGHDQLDNQRCSCECLAEAFARDSQSTLIP